MNRPIAFSFAVAGSLCVVLAAIASSISPQAEVSGSPAPLDGREGRPLALENFQPRSMLRVPENPARRAKFPVVDVHTHPRVRFTKSPDDELADFVKLMDEQNIAVCVSLDGGLGERLAEHQRFLWTKYRDRFVIFANIEFRGKGEPDKPATWDCNQPGFVERIVEQLRAAHASGVSGLKFFKEFGLGHKNADGSLVRIDDPKWDPIWETCGRLGLVVLIHTADPAAFFEPIDNRNERWEELRRRPEWSFHGEKWPKRDELFEALIRVVGKHRKTTFIAAHVGNAEDLAEISRWLDENPNLNVEIAARIGELGRQPRTAAKFFERYSDRIMFGTDGPRSAERLAPHWRFLETEDEYFPYAETPFPPQGFWNIYGIGLSDDLQKKVYFENAARLIPGVRERLNEHLHGPPR